MNNPDRKAYSELAIALKNDIDGTYKAGLIEQFNIERKKVKEELTKGLNPQDYSALNSFLVTIEEAIDMVEKVSVNIKG